MPGIRAHFAPQGRAWAVDQQPRRAAGNSDGQADHEERRPPFHCLDQRGPDGRHGQGANADSGDGDTGGEAAPAIEPFLDRTGGRNVRHPDADSDAHGKGGLDLPQSLGEAGNDEADTYQGRASGDKGRGPSLSATVPVTGPMMNSVRTAREKAAETEAREAPKASCSGAKKVPKE